MVKFKSKLSPEEIEEYEKIKKPSRKKPGTGIGTGQHGPPVFDSGGWCIDEEEEILDLDDNMELIKATKGGIEINKKSYMKKIG